MAGQWGEALCYRWGLCNKIGISLQRRLLLWSLISSLTFIWERIRGHMSTLKRESLFLSTWNNPSGLPKQKTRLFLITYHTTHTHTHKLTLTLKLINVYACQGITIQPFALAIWLFHSGNTTPAVSPGRPWDAVLTKYKKRGWIILLISWFNHIPTCDTHNFKKTGSHSQTLLWMATAVDAHIRLMMTLQKGARLKPIKPEAKPQFRLTCVILWHHSRHKQHSS